MSVSCVDCRSRRGDGSTNQGLSWIDAWIEWMGPGRSAAAMGVQPTADAVHSARNSTGSSPSRPLPACKLMAQTRRRDVRLDLWKTHRASRCRDPPRVNLQRKTACPHGATIRRRRLTPLGGLPMANEAPRGGAARLVSAHEVERGPILVSGTPPKPAHWPQPLPSKANNRVCHFPNGAAVGAGCRHSIAAFWKIWYLATPSCRDGDGKNGGAIQWQ